MTLRLDPGAADLVRRAAAAAYPGECCGLLLGSDGEAGERRVVRAVACRNLSPHPRRFRLADDEMLRVEAAAEREGLAAVGVFHSHPDAPAHPSAHDLEGAWPWLSYLIVAVEGGRPAGLRAWRLREERTEFVEEPIEILRRPA